MASSATVWDILWDNGHAVHRSARAFACAGELFAASGGRFRAVDVHTDASKVTGHSADRHGRAVGGQNHAFRVNNGGFKGNNRRLNVLSGFAVRASGRLGHVSGEAVFRDAVAVRGCRSVGVRHAVRGWAAGWGVAGSGCAGGGAAWVVAGNRAGCSRFVSVEL